MVIKFTNDAKIGWFGFISEGEKIKLSEEGIPWGPSG